MSMLFFLGRSALLVLMSLLALWGAWHAEHRHDVRGLFGTRSLVDVPCTVLTKALLLATSAACLLAI